MKISALFRIKHNGELVYRNMKASQIEKAGTKAAHLLFSNAN